MKNINDNIKFHYIPMEKLKTSTIGIYIHRPLTKEDASKNALLSQVLKRSCKLCPDSEAMEHYLEELYGAEARGGIIKRSEDQIIHFTFEAISDKYAIEGEPIFTKLTELAMSILFEPCITDGAFDEDIIAQEKKNLIERIEGIKNDKRQYAAIRCMQEMCKGDVYATDKLGTVQDVRLIDGKVLYEHYKSIITSSIIDIYVSGDVDTDAICDTVKKYTDTITFAPGEIRTTTLLAPATDVTNVEEPMDVTQGKLSIGFTTETSPVGDEYYALMVANSIFGAGAHSKLFNNVREKLSLCYYASSSMDRSKGLIIVNAGIEFDKFQKAYDEILIQLQDVKNGNVSELEYTSSIGAIINSLKSCFDDQYAMQSFYLSEEIYKSGLTLEDIIEKIKSVSLAEAVEASKKIKLHTVYFLKGVEGNA